MFSGALSHVLYEKVRIPSSQACLAGWYPEQAAEQLIPGKNCDLSWPTLVKGISIKRNLISTQYELCSGVEQLRQANPVSLDEGVCGE